MPIHSLGYRQWEGKETPMGVRWWVLTQTGIKLAWKNRWLRRSIMFAWVPALWFASAFFAYEFALSKYLNNPNNIDALNVLQRGFGVSHHVIDEIKADPQNSRLAVWSFLLLTFFRYPQAFLLMMVIGMVAPSLISKDLRARAYLMYFSRPLTFSEYLLGKAMVVFFYVFLITTAPALLLYAFAIFLSPSLSVFTATWILPLKILGASLVLMVPTTLLALTFSSLTLESRYAQFSWYAVWILSWVAYGAIEASGTGYQYISIFHALGEVQNWVFSTTMSASKVSSSLTVLAIITIVSLTILMRRIAAPVKV